MTELTPDEQLKRVFDEFQKLTDTVTKQRNDEALAQGSIAFTAARYGTPVHPLIELVWQHGGDLDCEMDEATASQLHVHGPNSTHVALYCTPRVQTFLNVWSEQAMVWDEAHPKAAETQEIEPALETHPHLTVIPGNAEPHERSLGRYLHSVGPECLS